MEDKVSGTLDGIVKYVSERGEVTVAEAASHLGLANKEVLDSAKILQKHDIVKIKYTVVGDVILEKGESMADAGTKELADQIFEAVKTDESLVKTPVDEIIDDIRERIMEKKYGKAGAKKLEENAKT